MRDMPPHRRILVLVGAFALSAGFLAYVGYVAGLWRGPTADAAIANWTYVGLILGAALACLARAAAVAPERLGWALIGAALAAYGAGEMAWVLSDGSLPTPSLADAGYLAFYLIAYAGLLALARERFGHVPVSRSLDGLIAGTALAALAAAFLIGPILEAGTGDSAAVVATNLSYPIADLTLLALVCVVAALSSWRPGIAWVTLGAGLLVMGASDVVYLFQAARGTYVANEALDLAWPAGVLLIAAAAWMPSGRRDRGRELGHRSVQVPALAALVAVGILFVDRYVEIPAEASALAVLTLLAVILRLALSFREGQATLDASVRDANTDPLTGLGNRRRFMRELERAAADSSPRSSWLLALYDLDGFKAYNDAFGHPAGDELLARLGGRLGAFAAGRGSAFRLGGDEFCLLAECTQAEVEEIVDGGAAALTEGGEGFEVSAARGSVLLPTEAGSAEAALGLADRRMYASKSRERASAGSQSRDVLMAALRERRPELHRHLVDVAGLVLSLAEELGLTGEKRDEVYRAAELHDVGKVAIPDAILGKPGPLDDRETEFMRKHPLIGERIIASAPALVPVARIVRCSHERPDGKGYPDGLTADEIPIGAKMIAVCDAYEAMVSERPYSTAMKPARALEELRRGAGTQFDLEVVEAFCRILTARSPAAVPGPGHDPCAGLGDSHGGSGDPRRPAAHDA